MEEVLSPAAIIACYLNDKLKTVIYTGKEPAGAKNPITIYDTGGRDPIRNLDGTESAARPSVQVRIKNKSYAEGYKKAEIIAKILNGLHNYEKAGRKVSTAARFSDIISLGEDENKNSVFTVNFNLTTQRCENE